MSDAPRIGVLAVQGNVREHAAMLRRLGATPVEVRKPEQLEELDGLVIPGGESTAIMRLVRLYGLEEAIRRFEQPLFGTCAGMILLDRNHLGLVDLEVDRNAYGRQVASFEADLELVKWVAEHGRLPVVTFTAGGIATPADAALCMQLGADGVFVGSGIFKSGDPSTRAKAIVEATTHFRDPEILGRVSRGLGDAMVGLSAAALSPDELLETRGW